MCTLSFLADLIRPSPLQVEHGVATICPSPLQDSQSTTFTNCPKTDCWTRRSSPLPWHRGQVVGWLPGSDPLPEQRSQVFMTGMSIDFSAPKTASSKLMDMS